MKEVSVFNAKTHFSGLVDHVYTKHETVTITRRGVKVAQIIPFELNQAKNAAKILRELNTLSEEIGRTGILLKEIKNMKEEGRK